MVNVGTNFDQPVCFFGERGIFLWEGVPKSGNGVLFLKGGLLFGRGYFSGWGNYLKYKWMKRGNLEGKENLGHVIKKM